MIKLQIKYLKTQVAYLLRYSVVYTMFPSTCASVKFRGTSVVGYPCVANLPLSVLFVSSY